MSNDIRVGPQGLFGNLVDLLGKNEEHPCFGIVLRTAQEEACIQEMKYTTFYDFPNTGFQLLLERGCFTSVLFFVDTPSVRDGLITSYSGDFPFAITSNDTREQVQHKIDRMPESWRYESRDFWDSYEFPDFKLVFTFDESSLRMALVSIRQRVKPDE